MGRSLPPEIYETLQAWSEAYPFTDGDRANWIAGGTRFAISRKTPDGQWMETWAPPGDPDPFALDWIPESTLWAMGLL